MPLYVDNSGDNFSGPPRKKNVRHRTDAELARVLKYGWAESLEGWVMERRRFKQTTSLEQRLTEQARQFRKQAKKLHPSGERDDLIRESQTGRMAAYMNEWLSSPGLRPPK